MNLLLELILFTIWILCSFVILLTGDIVLLAFSFGKHKPTWARYREKSNIGTQIFTELIFWIGTGTWILIAITINYLN